MLSSSKTLQKKIQNSSTHVRFSGLHCAAQQKHLCGRASDRIRVCRCCACYGSEFLSNTKNHVVKTAWLTRPGREKGSPLTTRVWGWRRWARRSHTALHRETQNQSKGFHRRLGCRITIRKLWEPLTGKTPWRMSKSHDFYHNSIMWHLETWTVAFCSWLHACYIPNHQSLLLRDWLCYIHFCKYIHISSVKRLFMEQGWSKTRCGCEYFQTCRESFSHYRRG